MNRQQLLVAIKSAEYSYQMVVKQQEKLRNLKIDSKPLDSAAVLLAARIDELKSVLGVTPY